MKWQRTWRWILGGLVLANLLLLLFIRQGPRGQTHVWIFPGGHGLLMMAPTTAVLLVDSGSDPLQSRYLIGQSLPFWKRTLDLAILTETDPEKVIAQAAVLRTYPAREGWYPLSVSSQAALEVWERHVREVRSTAVGLRWQTDGVQARLLADSPVLLDVQVGLFRLIYTPAPTPSIPYATVWVVHSLPRDVKAPLPPLVITRTLWTPGEEAIPRRLLGSPHTRFLLNPDRGIHLITDGQHYRWEPWP